MNPPSQKLQTDISYVTAALKGWDSFLFVFLLFSCFLIWFGVMWCCCFLYGFFWLLFFFILSLGDNFLCFFIAFFRGFFGVFCVVFFVRFFFFFFFSGVIIMRRARVCVYVC